MGCVVSAVVPAFAADAVVARSLAALMVALEQVDEPTELVVVLNRRFADTRFPPKATLVEPGENLGFAGSVTRALAASSGQWIALVNDDCVVERGALRAMLEAGESDARIGSVAGLLLFADRPGVVNSAGVDIDELGVASERLVGASAAAAVERTEVFGGSGGFTLYRRAMLEELGGFDESFFAYLEDADLAWRARMAGWRCVFEPAARALHAHSSSFGHASRAKHYLVGRNRVRMLAKNATTAQLRRRAAAIVLYDLSYVAYAAVRHRTFAPLAGRRAGLREWRRYRAAGAAQRAPVKLAPPPGFAVALRRDRAYRS